MNQIAVTKRFTAAIIACLVAAACGLFAQSQPAYAAVTATDSEALDAVVATQESAQTVEDSALIYRLYNPNTGEHFYTGVFKEAMSLVKAGWNYEKVAWQSVKKGDTLGTSTSSGGTSTAITAKPLYRLYNPYEGDHHYTLSEDEKKSLIKEDWKDEGIAFYAYDPDDVAANNLGTAAGDLAKVYREYNPNAKTGTHNYTMSQTEHKGLVEKGWKDEETAFCAKIYEEPKDFSVLSAALGRMYNPNSGEHFYTADPNEIADLVKAGWDFEGEAWTTFAKTDTAHSAAPVYRVYNPNSGDHHYTLSEEEKDGLVKEGWKDEGVAFYAAPKDKAEDTSGDYEAVYRAYNPNATAGSHHFTVEKDEVEKLAELGWKDEGIAWCGMKVATA